MSPAGRSPPGNSPFAKPGSLRLPLCKSGLPLFPAPSTLCPAKFRPTCNARWTTWERGWTLSPHQRLKGRAEFKLRVGDYRVLYEFDSSQGRIYLHYVGHRREIYQRT